MMMVGIEDTANPGRTPGFVVNRPGIVREHTDSDGDSHPDDDQNEDEKIELLLLHA
jgi:hypothetical protein